MDGRGWELLGLGYQLDGQSDLALQAFNHALELNPDLPLAAYYCGVHALLDENDKVALNYFQVAIVGLPDWFEAHIGLAQALLRTGNQSGAFLEVNSSSSLAETIEQRAAFFYWRATTLEALGQLQNAIGDWQS